MGLLRSTRRARRDNRAALPWLLRSTWALVASALVLAGLTLTAVHALDSTVRQRAATGTVHAGRLVSALFVLRQLHVDADGQVAGLDDRTRDSLDRSLRQLRETGQLEGLEVWRRDGGLVWADDEHDASETRLPADELHAVLTHPYLLHHTPAGDGRLRDALDVQQAYDLDDDRGTDVIVEVVFPPDAYDGAVSRARDVLYAGAGLLLTVLTGGLLLLRRRVALRSRQAVRDALTGLGNRTLLQEEAPGLLERPASLLLLDLDGFKEVNDTLGHAAGDELLVQVARVLADGCGPDDLLVRLGGDEFAVLVPGTPAEGVERAWTLWHAVCAPCSVSGVAVRVGASIGVAVAPEHGSSLAELLQHADVAMYQAKDDGSGVRTYAAEDDPHDARRLSLLADLPAAIREDQLVLDYQPKVRASDGAVVSLEALVRWQHPERGLLSPAAFIELAERTALIAPLTEWVLRTATRQTASWRADGFLGTVSVNVSARVLLDSTFPAMVESALADSGLPATALEVEITETAVAADLDRARRVLGWLRSLGVRIAIDDFGAGYTCLAHLRLLPVDQLKIDRSFIQALESIDTQPSDEAVVRSLLLLAHELGLDVVAEGVEDTATGSRLFELGCDQIQGFAYYRPLSPSAATAVLSEAHPRGAGQDPRVTSASC
ncbi:diguanylate cyclase (GGDEF)-like protein [Motilibacter rhizosphaerae]|uniref:Diguanylate cyclase (GGDEF)-like protein n=1 Tax=Motilibacter rhizosphaerae TaxID=598652 RepID=A0A4Q7NQL7_9ACTN|nr:EAL domain-containing protein [Motilibacter rhizosphaerae]RZS89347.1 diguanylate cyclase (GGDEF)-like protein [Motilibacter rhizosphaerae]